MRRMSWIVVVAVVLSAAVVLAGCSGASGGASPGAASPGKTIFTTGTGHAGTIPRSMGPGSYQTEGLPCAGCHGPAGQGTGIGPNITRATLGAQHTVTHMPTAGGTPPQQVTEGPWTPEQTVEVVRTGKTPEGNQLGGRMPRWQLDAQDASALAAYLGQL